MITKDFNTKMLLGIALRYSYRNDSRLYANLNYGYNAYNISLDLNNKELMEQVKSIEDNYSIEDILKTAVKRADMQDLLKLRSTFLDRHKDWNKEDIFSWKFKATEDHPFLYLKEVIESRSKELKENGYNNWHRSEDHIKHKHFRWWINRFKECPDNNSYRIRLFVCGIGSSYCRNTIDLCSSYYDNDIYQAILQYILDKNIIPDEDTKLEVCDFIGSYSFRNSRRLSASGEEGGFWYLVYLTAAELQEIYKTINKRQISPIDKASWAYINALKKEYSDTKLYLYIN